MFENTHTPQDIEEITGLSKEEILKLQKCE